jgi:ribose transport system permease protein
MSSLSYVFNSLLAVTIAQFISKYCGQVLATIIGTFTMKMLASGLLGMGISATWQNVCIGIFLLIFIAYSTNQQRFNDYLADKRRAAAINKRFLNENK